MRKEIIKKMKKKTSNEVEDAAMKQYAELRKLFVQDKKDLTELVNKLPTNYLQRLCKKKFKAYEDLFSPFLFKNYTAEDEITFKRYLTFDSEVMVKVVVEIDPMEKLLREHRGAFKSGLAIEYGRVTTLDGVEALKGRCPTCLFSSAIASGASFHFCVLSDVLL